MCAVTNMTQRTFASAEYAVKKNRARRMKFLDDMTCGAVKLPDP